MTQRRKKESQKSTLRGTLPAGVKRITSIFFRTELGNEPVREWLRSLPASDRRAIGEDVRIAEYGWPIGMPMCRPMGDGLHEVRTSLEGNRTARILFYVDRHQRMVLLHGFIKKTQATPKTDLDLARQNKNKHERGLR